MLRTRKKRIISIVLILLVIVASTLYLLADRYLIEHVEGRVLDVQPIETAAKVPNNISFDDWNYKSDNIQIKIDKVQTGSGSDLVTYFMADISLKDVSSLKSAFAENTFGRNIIEFTSKIAADNNAILAINGDYYGFRSDGILIRNGNVYRDIPTRFGAAFFEDGTLQSYDEKDSSSAKLLEKGATNTLSFGPVLLNKGRITSDFNNTVIDTNFGNKSIQGTNPRTGVGMISPNHFVFVVVDGRMDNYSKGMTLSEFAQLFADLGCQEAYNLDGGGSSTMYFMGRIVNNPLGKNKERGVSDIIYIK